TQLAKRADRNPVRMGRRQAGSIGIICDALSDVSLSYDPSIADKLAPKIAQRVRASLVISPVRIGIINHQDEPATSTEQPTTFLDRTLEIAGMMQTPNRHNEIETIVGEGRMEDIAQASRA